MVWYSTLDLDDSLVTGGLILVHKHMECILDSLKWPIPTTCSVNTQHTIQSTGSAGRILRRKFSSLLNFGVATIHNVKNVFAAIL